MAPSPTGDIHIGSLRTALYAYAYAKKIHGRFIVRIEDTDRKRLVAGAADRTLQVFKDFHLNYDEGPDVGGSYGPYIQTARLDIYQKYIKKLLDKGLAYYCFCTEERLATMRDMQKVAKKGPKYDRLCLTLTKTQIAKNLDKGIPYVVRLKVPDNQTIVFKDVIRGEIKFSSNDIDDQVLIKSNGIPTYHFAVVVDDHLMDISHIIRGEEWISSTPKQVILYQYFGWTVPQFCHLTVLLDPSHPGKMSKRYGSVFARQFLDEGYLPEAMLNFLMLLGWNPGTDRELFTLGEFVKEFSFKHLHVKQPIFDRQKLDYLNGLYIRNLTDGQLTGYFKKFLPQASADQIKILIPILKERIVKFGDLPQQLKFLFTDIVYDKNLLLKKGTDPKIARSMLESSKKIVENFTDLSNKFLELIKTNGWNTGEFFMVFRVAVCGSVFTPPVVECLPALGKENTLRKIDIAINLLK